MSSWKSEPSHPILRRSERNLELQSDTRGQNDDQDLLLDISSIFTMEQGGSEQGGSKLVSTYENEIKQVSGCAEQNVSVRSPPRSYTSLFGKSIGFYQVREVSQPDSSPQVKENGIANQDIGARSSGVITMQADQPPQQSMIQVDEVNRGHMSGELDEASGSRKQAKVRTLDVEYEISREVLEQHSGKKLEGVADILGVSRSTLKRICRKYGIYRWPPKGKRHNNQEFAQETGSDIEEFSQRNQSVSDLPLEILTAPEPKLMQDDSSIMVKATYKDDIIKFGLLLASRKLDLEREVAMRLNLSVGSFKIKYLDEEGDWVLISCDADLRTCITTFTSFGKTTIRMLIYQLPS